MQPGFQKAVWRVATVEFKNFVLLDTQIFVDYNGDVYVLPRSATSDLCSIPSALESVIPANTAAKEGFLHDCAFRNTLQKMDGSLWALTEEQSNDLFERALKLNKETSGLIDWDLYHAVEWFGSSSFNEDRAKGTAAFMADVSSLE